MAYEPKKNNLFFMAAPPMLPPKSFKWYLGFAAPLASFTQLFAFNAELRWSSKRRPWNVLLPRRVTKLTWKFDCPNPVLVLSWSVWTVISCMSSRSEEHTSELQSRLHLVCRLLLEKKKNPVSSDCRSEPSSSR